MIDPQILDLHRKLIKQQLEVLAKGSVLSRERKAMGEMKKTRDGIIAELTRLEVKLTEMELPFGLTTNEQGYVIVDKDADSMLAPDHEDEE